MTVIYKSPGGRRFNKTKWRILFSLKQHWHAYKETKEISLLDKIKNLEYSLRKKFPNDYFNYKRKYYKTTAKKAVKVSV